jgi:hypothetical protein
MNLMWEITLEGGGSGEFPIPYLIIVEVNINIYKIVHILGPVPYWIAYEITDTL